MISDTIAAIATAPGEGGIGIIRVSGQDSWSIVDKFFKVKKGVPLIERTSHTINYGHFNNEQGQVIDECLVSVMRGPKTFTGEDVVEINCHGSYLALQQILKVLLVNGIRLAEAGEFSKRAFLNGRIDLAQAESIIDIIRAKTEDGLHFAINQLQGVLSKEIESMRKKLLGLLAIFEANIDFPEEDVPPINYTHVKDTIVPIIKEVDKLLATWDEGKIYREGLKTVIIGRPNVGKSSLLNLLVKDERAIVTDIPGTTRDVIEEIINIGGIPLRIIDTAGIRKAMDEVEKIGVEKSISLIDNADLILYVIDATLPLSNDDEAIFQRIATKNVVFLLNKIDLPQNHDTIKEVNSLAATKPIIKISAKEKLGIEKLTNTIKDLVYSGKARISEHPTITNSRHYAALKQANQHLHGIIEGVEGNLPVDFLSIDLTSSYEKFGEVTGSTVGEDVIDQIFSEFCIGK
ncbi:MAG: tRNA uridine-5-carboxymethylaminomethyl(34) synthesis GTPase MnmE [Bacillota bacterium]|nr:tRNA uridine-5-carboxymethylaminomethyl(34) synthesis GTPase MnmE [Bacillota bacterium]